MPNFGRSIFWSLKYPIHKLSTSLPFVPLLLIKIEALFEHYLIILLSAAFLVPSVQKVDGKSRLLSAHSARLWRAPPWKVSSRRRAS